MLGVSKSGFYAWRGRPLSRHALEDHFLGAVVEAIHAASYETYGAPRIRAELVLGHNLPCATKRVARLMAERKLVGCHRRRRRSLTRSGGSVVHPSDLVRRNFRASAPNRLWMTDLTYVPTATGFCYLAAVIDAYSRAIVGWSVSSRPRAKVAIDALEDAVAKRSPQPGVIVHSDRGLQFSSIGFENTCRRIGARRSVGRAGSCHDNAVAESFFATLECELLDQVRLAGHDDAWAVIGDFVDAFYNRRRRHSYLGYRSPLDYEKITAPQSNVSTKMG